MNARSTLDNVSCIELHHHRAAPTAKLLLVLCLLPTQLRAATNTVTTLADSGPGSFRQTILDSAPGDTIIFAVTSGTLNLSQNLVIDRNLTIWGPGATNLTISGGHSTRIIYVWNGVSALISGFALRDGQSPDGVNGVVFSEGNVSPGTPGEPGGAIYTAGTLTVRDCVFRNNAAGRGGDGAPGELGRWLGSPGANGGAGGAIYNTGSLTLSNCLLHQNASGAGGASGVQMTYSQRSGQGGPGGAICSSGTLRLFNTVITNNQTGSGASTPLEASGADGGSGGGVWCSASLTANDSLFLGNSTGGGGGAGGDSYLSGHGGMGGSGGGIWCGGLLALTNCVVSGNYCGGGGGGGSAPHAGAGGDGGFGCGICSTNGAMLVRCTIIDNLGSFGGNGGRGVPYSFGGSTGGGGGSGSCGAGIYASGNLMLTDCTVSRNSCGRGGAGGGGEGFSPSSSCVAGSGGPGGFGGGIFALLDLSLTNCTVSDNTAGNGGQGGDIMYFYDRPGDGGTGGKGGGIYRASATNAAVLAGCSVAGNHAGSPGTSASGGQVGEDGTGGGVWAALSGAPPRPLQCLNAIVALNSGAAPDVWGSFASLGHNLIGVTNGGSSFRRADDRVGSSASPLDPKLGPLADNGGPTLTRALLPCSPAIDAGTGTGVPPTDQRGVARPQGAGVDIGAFEYQYTIPAISGSAFQGADFWLRCCGLPNSAYTIQVSTNLLDWSDLDSFMSNINGLFDYVDPAQVNHNNCFYRLKYTGP